MRNIFVCIPSGGNKACCTTRVQPLAQALQMCSEWIAFPGRDLYNYERDVLDHQRSFCDEDNSKEE